MKEKTKNTVIFGKHPVVDAIQSGKPFEKVLLQNTSRSELFREMKALCKKFNIPLQVVPKEKLNRITSANHQGIIGLIAPVTFQKLDDILPWIYEKGETPLLLVLDGITDVRNFGSIARSAEVFGVHAIVFEARGNAQINADAIKTSAGALLKIPLCREKSILQAIESLQMNGVEIFASDLRAKTPITDLDLTVPTAIIIGSEGRGVSPKVIKATDHSFIIPQVGETDSLNVSVASGIILYETQRQRKNR